MLPQGEAGEQVQDREIMMFSHLDKTYIVFT